MRATTQALRDAVAAQGVTVYAAGEVPASPAYPYVVVSASTPTPADYSAAALRSSSRWRVATLYVGDSEEGVFWLAERVEAALLDRRLTVAGLSCSRIKRESGAPARVDPDAEGAVVATDVWTFTTTNS